MSVLVSVFLSLVLALGIVLAFVVLFQRRALLSADEGRLKADERVRSLEAREAEVVQSRQDALLEQRWALDSLSASDSLVFAYGVMPENFPSSYVFVNDAACRALGYEKDQLLAMSPVHVEIFRGSGGSQPGGDLRFTELANTTGLAEEGSYARRGMELLIGQIMREKNLDYDGGFLAKDGRLIPAMVHAVRADLCGRPRIVCYAKDLTAEKERDSSAREHERLLDDLLTNSPVGVVLFDRERSLKDVNQACLKMFGCPDVQEFGRLNLLESKFFPAEAKVRLSRGESFRFEMAVDFELVRKEAIFASSRHGVGRYEMHVTNLGLAKDFSARGFVVQVEDVTRLRGAEDQVDALQEELRQAKKMEAIGVLAGGIAHDFNNILTPILGYADLSQDLCEEGSTLRSYLNEIVAASKRAKELVEQILVFSRRGETTSKPMRLAPIVKEVSKQVAASAPPGVTVDCSVRTDDDRVLAMPTQIHQVLMNLCSNACYVMRNAGGRLDISLTGFVLSHIHKSEFPQLATRSYLRSGEKRRYVRLTVSDNGPGMDAETMSKIFEPFFTTKPSGEGTGMGLALVQGIVTALGGEIRVESSPRQGATFHVAIPVAQERKEENAGSPVRLSRKGGRVLFVDDEIAIVRMAEKMLASLGYEAVVTSRSREALELFRRNPDHFDIIITDQVMPDLTGAELTRELLRIRHGIPVVLCTGFSEKFPREKAEETGIREFVMKPIVRQDLALAIERALGRDAAGMAPAQGR